MLFRAKKKSGQWEYSDPIQHQFAWYCETYGFDMSHFDFFLDNPENKLDEHSCNTLHEKRSQAFEAYQQKNYALLKERLDYLLLALKAINQSRAASRISELVNVNVTVDELRATSEALQKLLNRCESTELILGSDTNKQSLFPTTSSYIPSNAIGKIAIKAAVLIEESSKKRATYKEVMMLLKEWAENGNEPSYLIKYDDKKKNIIWNTEKSSEAKYTHEACSRTLSKWNKGRNKDDRQTLDPLGRQ